MKKINLNYLLHLNLSPILARVISWIWVLKLYFANAKLPGLPNTYIHKGTFQHFSQDYGLSCRTILVVHVNSIREWRNLQFNVESAFSWQIYLLCQKSVKREPPKKYFFHISVWWLTWDTILGFTSNNPTHFPLDYGGFQIRDNSGHSPLLANYTMPQNNVSNEFHWVKLFKHVLFDKNCFSFFFPSRTNSLITQWRRKKEWRRKKNRKMRYRPLKWCTYIYYLP